MLVAGAKLWRRLQEKVSRYVQTATAASAAAATSNAKPASIFKSAADGFDKPRKTGIAHCTFTNSNVFVAITDFNGNVKKAASSGMVGFTGSRRDTKYAANAVSEHVSRAASALGIKSVEVRLKGGFGIGKRKYLLRGFKQGGLNVSKIRDITPIPHNGCRPQKKRRV